MVATTYNLWDAHRVFGCVCDHGFSGYDCSLQDCPMGIDPLRPTTNEVNEVQTFKCHDGNDGAVSSGTFSMTFRGHTTKSMSYDITAANLETELETLPTITDVTVTYPSTDWRTASAARYARITFLREHGISDISVFSGGPTILLNSDESVDGVGTPFPATTEDCAIQRRVFVVVMVIFTVAMES